MSAGVGAHLGNSRDGGDCGASVGTVSAGTRGDGEADCWHVERIEKRKTDLAVCMGLFCIRCRVSLRRRGGQMYQALLWEGMNWEISSWDSTS